MLIECGISRFLDQCHDEMIQAGSEVVDNLSRKDSEAVWGRWLSKHRNDVVSSFVLEIFKEPVGLLFAGDEGMDLSFEIIDALVYTFKFRFDPCTLIQ